MNEIGPVNIHELPQLSRINRLHRKRNRRARHQFWFSGARDSPDAAFFDCRERLYCFSNETLNGKDYSYASPFYAEEKPLLTVDEFGTDRITQECVGYLGSDRNPPGLSFEPVLEYVWN